MFHISNFGKFSGGLAPFADLNGYVPKAGDDQAGMAYQEPVEDWEAFRAAAIEATTGAQKALSAWQDGPRKPGRPPNKYKAGEGAPKKSVRLEEPYLSFVENFPGGLKGIVEAAYRRKLKPYP